MVDFNKKKLIIILILAQTCLVLFLNVFVLGSELWDEYYKTFSGVFSVVLLLAGVLGVSSFFIVIEVLKLIEKDTEAEITKLQLEQLKNMNIVLREQRHDMKNHFQVILGFIQLGKFDKAEDYVKGILQEKNLSLKNIDKIEAPETIRILLGNKLALAEEKRIKFNLDIKASIENYKISSIDLTRILWNLLTNAFYAAERHSADKWVLFSVREDKGLIIEVANSGEPIPEELRKDIFKPGVTTKGDKGDGMGLHIVKTLTAKNKGKVKLIRSDEKETRFRIFFSQSLKKAS